MATTSPTTNGKNKNNNSNNTILASSFIPLEPEEISAEWLFEVINQYRKLKEMSLVKEADDLLSCEIKEKKSSKGRLSSTYIIEIKFKVSIYFREINFTKIFVKLISRKNDPSPFLSFILY